MFSGLTNQFTSLVGAVKGGAGDEDVPAPTGEAAAAAQTASTSSEAVAAAADPEAAAAAGAEGLEGEEAGKRWVLIAHNTRNSNKRSAEAPPGLPWLQILTSPDLTWRVNVTLQFVPFNISLAPFLAQFAHFHATFIIVWTEAGGHRSSCIFHCIPHALTWLNIIA